MKTRKLGDLKVSAVGYGCMGLSHGYGPVPEEKESLDLIRFSFDQGCNFFDTAEVYGNGHNEILLGKAVKNIRNEVVIATKLHIQKNENDTSAKALLKNIKSHLEKSLQNLGMDHVELYYQHRVNKDIPVEDVAWCMGELIREGKILGWGQSQATEEEIRRAHAVAPLTAIQSEYSMMERMFEKDVIPTCKELGIGFVAFSPMASGFLSGKTSLGDKYVGDDVRRTITRFDKENVRANQPLLDLLEKVAREKDATKAQISLAWMLHGNDFIVPIPGSRKRERIAENQGAADVILSDSEFKVIQQELNKITIHGNRTDEDIAKLRGML